MRGYVVDKEGKPLQFRVLDPISGHTELAVLQVRGGMMSMHSVPQGQMLPAGMEQHQPEEYTPAGRHAGARYQSDFVPREQPQGGGATQPQDTVPTQGEPAAATT